jgi:hypothetical protein
MVSVIAAIHSLDAQLTSARLTSPPSTDVPVNQVSREMALTVVFLRTVQLHGNVAWLLEVVLVCLVFVNVQIVSLGTQSPLSAFVQVRTKCSGLMVTQLVIVQDDVTTTGNAIDK